MTKNSPGGQRAPLKMREISRLPSSKQALRPADVAADSYHHGALREALLNAAEQILLEQGMEGFTLRACARRAGVSHGAPAHHFGDVKGLLTEFAARGYERLTGMTKTYRAQALPGSRAQVAAVGQAYIDFALAHRAQFQLMYRADRINENDVHFIAASMASYDQFDSALANFLNENSSFDDAIIAKQLLAWSAVHGFASLLLEGRLRYFFNGKSRDEFAHQMGRQMIALLSHALTASETELK